MDLDTQQQYTNSTHLEDYGLDDLPEFECLCELCDCGCFEQSKQPHSLNCRRFFDHAGRAVLTKSTDLKPTVRRSSSINHLNSSRERQPNLLASGSELPKGVLSEYQVAFVNNSYDNNKQAAKFKLKDNLSLFTDNGKPSEAYSDFSNSSFNLNQTNRTPLRSKTLNRLNNMMPANENGVSWYQSDFNFLGTDDPKSATRPARSSFNSLDHYKKEYLRNFEELNKGLVDSYSMSKGSPPLVSTRENSNPHSRAIYMSQELFKSPSSDSSILASSTTNENSKYPKVRQHDFRPVWIPKKYDGRNMFVSHIESALFPDKERREFETQYNNYYDSQQEKRVTFDRDSYVGKFPSYKYIQNYENKLVPTMKWTQTKDTYDYEKPTRVSAQHSSELPSKSIYQADFDTPQIIKKSTLCKAALVQTLMRRDKRLALKLNKNQPTQLKSALKQRYNDIQAYNIY